MSSVLGSGILVLPGLAARIAGPGSLVAWGFLAFATLPFAFTFASLSARRPESGGIYGFVKEAFGSRAGVVTGWLFALWVITGVPAVALIAASYLGYAFPLSRPETYLLGYLIVGAAYAVNLRGIVVSNRVQLAVIGAIVALLIGAIAFSGARVHAANFQPFLPFGWLPIGTAAAPIFWSFLGYENVSNVAEEFQDPARDFPRSVSISVALVGGLYFAAAFVTVGTAAYSAGGSVAPFAALLGNLVGPYGEDGTAILAVFIIFGVVNAYTTGMSRVMYAVARDGGFPSALAHLDPRTRAPDRALYVLLGGSTVVFTAYYFAGVDLTAALLVASGAALLTYVLGSAAGVRLRPPILGAPWASRWFPAISLAISLVVLPFIGPLVFVGLGTVLAAVAYSAVSPRSRRGRRGDRAPEKSGEP